MDPSQAATIYTRGDLGLVVRNVLIIGECRCCRKKKSSALASSLVFLKKSLKAGCSVMVILVKLSSVCLTSAVNSKVALSNPLPLSRSPTPISDTRIITLTSLTHWDNVSDYSTAAQWMSRNPKGHWFKSSLCRCLFGWCSQVGHRCKVQ